MDIGRNYAIQIIRDPGGFIYAAIPDLVGCSATGATVDEALKNVEKDKKRWLREAKKRGQKIPIPDYEKTFSGRFVLRLDPEKHEQLSKKAKQLKISLNQLILNLLQAGETNVEFEEIRECLEHIRDVTDQQRAKPSIPVHASTRVVIHTNMEDAQADEFLAPHVDFKGDVS